MRILTAGRILGVIFLASACSERKIDVSRNEEAAPVVKAKASATQPRARLKINSDAEALELAADILSDAKLSSPEFLADIVSVQRLGVLNEYLVAKKVIDGPRGLAELYVNAVSAGCDSALIGCRNLGYFRRDPLSSKVLQKISRSEKEIVPRYRLLMLAFEIKNTVADDELDLLYAQDSLAFEKTIAAQPPLLKKHRLVLELILKRQKYSRTASGWVLSHGAFDFDPSRATSVNGDMQTLAFLLARDHLYKNGQLTDEFKAAIKKSQALDKSFSASQKSFREGAPQIFAALGLKELTARNENFFLIDRVYNESINPNDMMEFFKVTSRNLSELDQMAVQYMEIVLGYTIYESNKILAEKLKDPSIRLDDRIEKAVEYSRLIYPATSDLIRRADAVLTLLKMAHQLANQELDKKTQVYFESVRPNIKFSLTYPQMMALAYDLAKNQFSKTFNFFYFTITLDANTVLQSLFNGEYEPFFNYGHDTSALTRHEIMVAFDLALKTGTFETFGVDPADFLNLTFTRLAGTRTRQSELKLALINTRYNDPRWKTILKMCQSLPKIPEFTFEQSIEVLQHAPLGELIDVLTKSGSDTGGVETESDLKNQGPRFYPHSSQISRQLEEIRVDHKPFLRQGRQLLRMYENHLVRQQVGEDKRKALLKKAEAPILALQTANNNLASEFVAKNKLYATCFPKIMEFDKTLQLSLIRYEQEYLRQIHRSMKLLRGPGVADRAAELNTKMNFYGIPGFAGYQSFDKDQLYFFRADFYMRIKKYLSEGLKTDTVTLPPIDPYLRISVPENYLNSSILSTKVQEQIPWIEDEAAFAKQGLTAIFGKGTNATLNQWYGIYFISGEAEYGARLWYSDLAILFFSDYQDTETHQKVFDISVDDFVSIPETLSRAFGISTLEGQWMEAIGVREKSAMPELLAPAMVDHDTLLVKPPFDYLMEILSYDFLGQYDDLSCTVHPENGGAVIERPSFLIAPLNEVKSYAKFRSSKAVYPFNVSADALAEMDGDYKKDVKDYISKVEAIQNAVVKKYAEDRQNGKLQTPMFRLGERYEGPYYLPKRVSEFRSKIQIFNEETQSYFTK